MKVEIEFLRTADAEPEIEEIEAEKNITAIEIFDRKHKGETFFKRYIVKKLERYSPQNVKIKIPTDRVIRLRFEPRKDGINKNTFFVIDDDYIVHVGKDTSGGEVLFYGMAGIKSFSFVPGWPYEHRYAEINEIKWFDMRVRDYEAEKEILEMLREKLQDGDNCKEKLLEVLSVYRKKIKQTTKENYTDVYSTELPKEASDGIAKFKFKYDYCSSPESPKGTFDYIHVEIPVIQSVGIDWLKKYHRDITRMAIGKLKEEPKFKKYGVPVNFLKVENCVLTKDGIVIITFGLKK